MKRKILLVVAALLLLAGGALAEGSWLASMLGEQPRRSTEVKREGMGYIALLKIDGELSAYDYIYDHEGTLEVLRQLCEDEENEALLIVLNTPGGSLYESDELYHALLTYKEETGRPVYAYMAQECCSGGVYVAMAADRIMASRMTLTGSVGVYMTSYSEAGFYDKLGIEREYVVTGENKVSGYPTLTEEQRAIEQALVDESFAFFKQVIAQSRSLSEEQMAAFTDGRVLSAIQAKEMGLIDDVLFYDEALHLVGENHGGEETEIRDVTPTWSMLDDEEEMNFFDWLRTDAKAGGMRRRAVGHRELMAK